ncbi:hypothetical protein MNBD_GAMMA14-396, partial [hydrothermal vent metagenome]
MNRKLKTLAFILFTALFPLCATATNTH